MPEAERVAPEVVRVGPSTLAPGVLSIEVEAASTADGVEIELDVVVEDVGTERVLDGFCVVTEVIAEEPSFVVTV